MSHLSRNSEPFIMNIAWIKCKSLAIPRAPLISTEVSSRRRNPSSRTLVRLADSSPRHEITRSARLITKNFLDILFVRSAPDGLSLPQNGESLARDISWTI